MGIRGIRISRMISADPVADAGRTDAIGGVHNKTGHRTGGRLPDLIMARNRHLMCRFVYWNQNPGLKYEWVVSQLSREFYLSPSTVGQIIAANVDQIVQLRAQKNIAAWKREYDFFRW